MEIKKEELIAEYKHELGMGRYSDMKRCEQMY